MQSQLQSFSGNETLVDLFRQQIQQLQFTEIMLPEQTLNQMIQEELIRQEAARRGLTVTAEEIDEETKTSFGDPPVIETEPSPTAGLAGSAASQSTDEAAPTAETAPTAEASPVAEAAPTAGADPTAGAAPAGEATPAATAVPVSPVPTADVQARLAEFLSIYEITEAEYKQMVEVQVLYRKLEESMGAEVPTSANQVHARHILVETEEKAKELVEKQRNGESFEELAKAESTDAGSKDQGGDLGWFGRRDGAEFDEVVFKLAQYDHDPVSTTYGCISLSC